MARGQKSTAVEEAAEDGHVHQAAERKAPETPKRSRKKADPGDAPPDAQAPSGAGESAFDEVVAEAHAPKPAVLRTIGEIAEDPPPLNIDWTEAERRRIAEQHMVVARRRDAMEAAQDEAKEAKKSWEAAVADLDELLTRVTQPALAVDPATGQRNLFHDQAKTDPALCWPMEGLQVRLDDPDTMPPAVLGKFTTFGQKVLGRECEDVGDALEAVTKVEKWWSNAGMTEGEAQTVLSVMSDQLFPAGDANIEAEAMVLRTILQQRGVGGMEDIDPATDLSLDRFLVNLARDEWPDLHVESAKIIRECGLENISSLLVFAAREKKWSQIIPAPSPAALERFHEAVVQWAVAQATSETAADDGPEDDALLSDMEHSPKRALAALSAAGVTTWGELREFVQPGDKWWVGHKGIGGALIRQLERFVKDPTRDPTEEEL